MSALSLQNLTKTYKSNGHIALNSINLEVAEGDFFALLGPNGAGKSTAIGIIASLVNKSSGRVQVFGSDLDLDPNGVKSNIGLVPQEFNFNQFEPVEEILVNQAGYHGIPRRQAFAESEKWLKKLELWGKRRAMARELSGGMKRRLMIARALIHRPRLLILDEPTAGVDIEIRRAMWQFLTELNREGTTIILTTHYLEEAESLCRNIAIINQGEIVEHGGMSQLLSKLHKEHLVLNLAEPPASPPTLAGYPLVAMNDDSLEVEITQGGNLNDLFRQLEQQGLQVTSIRNKQNRLERIMLEMADQRGRTS
jgi:ABC-2 type transport system ATP-binding protein